MGPLQPKTIIPHLTAFSFLGFAYSFIAFRLSDIGAPVTLLSVAPFAGWALLSRTLEARFACRTLRNVTVLRYVLPCFLLLMLLIVVHGIMCPFFIFKIRPLLDIVATVQLVLLIVNFTPSFNTLVGCLIEAMLITLRVRAENFMAVSAMVVLPVVSLVIKLFT